MIDELVANLLNEEGDIRSLIEASVRRLGKRSSGLEDNEAHKYMKRNIRKGDVIVVGPMRREPSRVVRAFYGVNKAIFGPNSAHVDMYAGKDKVITADDRGVITKSFKGLVGNRDHITVMRPKMSLKQKNKALRYANKQIGTSFGARNLIGATLKELHPRLSLGPLSRAKNAFICSGLLANSLKQGGVDVHKKKSADFVAPKDFRTSDNLKKVMVFDRSKDTDKWNIVQRAARRRKLKQLKRQRRRSRK